MLFNYCYNFFGSPRITEKGTLAQNLSIFFHQRISVGEQGMNHHHFILEIPKLYKLKPTFHSLTCSVVIKSKKEAGA